MKKLPIIVLFFVLWSFSTVAQTDYTKQYFNAKTLFREGKYNLAMESFRTLIPHDQGNRFSEYASFYYALAAYHQGYLAVAKDMFNQIKKLYPSWDKTEEVDFWLGKIHMDNKDYFQAIRTWNTLKSKTLQQEVEKLKINYLTSIEDAETLRMMNEEYPNDQVIARLLAKALSKNITDLENRDHLESLIKKYNFRRADFINEAPPTYFKSTYTVAALFPFMLSTLDPTPVPKRNQIILDLYEGMKMAADTLQKQGVSISLRAYDTERRSDKIRRLTATEELKNTDLIIGPFFPEENDLVQEFSMKNRINVFKPFTNNFDMVSNNEFGFLFQPSYETLGRKSAEFLADYVKRRKNCIVIYGATRKDSVQAAAFMEKAAEAGLNVVHSMQVPRDATGKILSVLQTATEYDEWKAPIEFTLKKDSIGSIYVASDDALIYTKVISSVETRADSVIVLGSHAWLDQHAIDFEKYQTLGVVLTAPNFIQHSNAHYTYFRSKFIQKHGRVPDEYAALGYEMMLFLGNALKKYGVYFQEGFNREKMLKGYLTDGYSYQYNRDNQLVPFIQFKNGQLTTIQTK